MKLISFVTALLVFCLSGCPERRPPAGEGSPKVETTPAEAKAQFVRVSDAYGVGTSRIIGRDDLLFGGIVPNAQGTYQVSDERLASTKRMPGDFLGRIWSLYGPPGSGEASSPFSYTFIDRKTAIIFTAYAADGPSYGGASRYGGPFPPSTVPDEHLIQGGTERSQVLEVVKRFEKLLEQSPLADCVLVQKNDFGLFRIGARAGMPFQEKMSFAGSIDFYTDLINRFGPERDVGAYHLAYPEQQIRWLWVGATDDERKQRPTAIELARHAWQRDLEKLEKRSVKRTSDQSAWRSDWNALDAHARLLGVDTPENRRSLDRLREPPRVPAAALDDEVREEAEILKLREKRDGSIR